jgi:SAM-dependent methyltransferase
MTASATDDLKMILPSAWVVRHAPLIPRTGAVVDLACGSGRHARWLAGQGWAVLAVDRNQEAISALSGVAGVTAVAMDLEGSDWPLAGRRLAGVVVTNYLWRPRLADVLALLAPGGVLIYETFMAGNEAYGKPANPEFLLRSGELRAVAKAGGLREIAFREGYGNDPKPGMRQAICAVRE